jgi:formate hydrogenlyase subunit 3/multisubunit Na+/H+ antiporter MnhD subunit
MIAAVGVMIGVYVILRCLDILARPKSSFASDQWRMWMQFAAVIVALFQVTLILGWVIRDMLIRQI